MEESSRDEGATKSGSGGTMRKQWKLVGCKDGVLGYDTLKILEAAARELEDRPLNRWGCRIWDRDGFPSRVVARAVCAQRERGKKCS